MYASPNPLSTEKRSAIALALNGTLIDSLDLYTQLKVAHWNIKGPHFVALHPLFDAIATELLGFTDQIAERMVTLGGTAKATARHVAAHSRISEYSQETVRDLEHVQLLVTRFEQFLSGVRSARNTADEHDDGDTVDLLTAVVSAFEKHSWFLRATLGQ